MLPPSGADAEAVLAAWWLTRVGLVVLVIAAVFFGVRVAAEVSPWVRVATLAATSLAVLALGRWLERRLEGFGRLVSAGGFAVGYFTAFAAYAVPATKVIASPAAGFLAQAAVAALGRQALHAAELAFVHPATAKRLQFESPLPADMAALVAALRMS